MRKRRQEQRSRPAFLYLFETMVGGKDDVNASCICVMDDLATEIGCVRVNLVICDVTVKAILVPAMSRPKDWPI